MSILGGMTTDYSQDTGSLIISSVITKGLFAINDIDARFNPMDLTLGANGGINMIVGTNSGPDVPENCISLVDNFKGVSGIYNFEVHGSNAIALQPSDLNSTVYIGDAVIYSDTQNVYISTYDKGLTLSVENLDIDGPLICKESLKVDGEIYTGEINLTNFTESNITGYAFKINSTNNNLELVKYFHDHNNSNLSSAQLVAAFGKGSVFNDPTQSYNIFENSSSNSSGQSSGSQNNGNINNGGESVWSTSGNDIYFGGNGGTQQKVGINTTTPMYHLDVVGKIQGTEFIVNTSVGYDPIIISERGITGLNSIEVDSVPNNGIYFRNIISEGVGKYWTGHASNLHELDLIPLTTFVKDMDIGDFYTGTNKTWFDTETANILLSSFSNDVFNEFDQQFETCDVSIELTANNTITSNLTVLNNAIFNQTSIGDLTVTNDVIVNGKLSVSEIDTSILNTTDINTTNIITDDITIKTANIEDVTITNTLDAATITALVNKLVADQVESRLATISGTLSVANLVVDTCKNSLVPEGNEILDLGTNTNRWRDLYLSGNTLNVDNFQFQVNTIQEEVEEKKELTIHGGDVNLGRIKFNANTGIVFDDGTHIASMTEIASSVTEGDEFGDFSSLEFKVYDKGGRRFIQEISGSFIYSRSHNIIEDGNRWRAIDFNGYDILPIRSDGIGVDRSSIVMDSVKYGGNPKEIQVPFLRKNTIIGDNIFVTSDQNINPNHMYPLRNLDPFSKYFRYKCKADFNYYHNILESDSGNEVTDVAIYFEPGNEVSNQYVQLNDFDNFIQRLSGNKYFEIEILTYNKPPLYETKFITNNMQHKYLIPNSPQERIDKVYESVQDEILGVRTYQLVDVDVNYGLYPKISIQRWDNSMNITEFTNVIYDPSMNWGGTDNNPDIEIVFQRFKDNGWITTLFKLTYNYIMNGVVEGEILSIPQSVLNDIDTLDSNSIIFISSGNLILNDGTSIDSNTKFCLKKSVFTKYI